MRKTETAPGGFELPPEGTQVYLLTKEAFETAVRDIVHKAIAEYKASVKEAEREPYITVPAAMELLHVKKTTLWQLNKRGLLPTCKVGQRTLYRRADIERFLGEDKKGRK
ncbi:MAG: helix-turn-helix domain-containing protein [Tannerellaceae bacterium]|jgi:predicted DNA-binding transcriptional regulator AlpA|nr:helix-turn-helix domain-containing protein [Tannerellaceae bacterium]